MSHTYHSAVGHGALGFAGTFGALPPLWVSIRRLADLEDVPGGSGAVFSPIRCRTHAYTPTNKSALIQNEFILYPPKLHHFLSSSLTTLHQLFTPNLSVCVQFTFANYWLGSISTIAIAPFLFPLPPLVCEREQMRSPTSLKAQEQCRMSARDSSPHCLDCDGAQVTFTPAAHGAQRRLHTQPGVQLAERDPLTHRCREGASAFTDTLQMQPFFVIARFHEAAMRRTMKILIRLDAT